MDYTTIIAVPASASAALQYIAPFSGTAMAEYFMYEGKDVLIVEDILDTGFTLSFLYKLLEDRKPASVEICTLLDKPERRKVDVAAKYVGRKIPDALALARQNA